MFSFIFIILLWRFDEWLTFSSILNLSLFFLWATNKYIHIWLYPQYVHCDSHATYGNFSLILICYKEKLSFKNKWINFIVTYIVLVQTLNNNKLIKCRIFYFCIFKYYIFPLCEQSLLFSSFVALFSFFLLLFLSFEMVCRSI